ncbi:ABC transporter permease [Porticoccus sp. W117]|uniref:MlaE family ABC transporter permease n=1 Tax=Porticoccus sp. W117 TaxID=3054777 RepID=UPI002591BE20|nr:ABC transporter permease [Porticoccus sp. W117]MDM3870023.1 ABC transporter permease [Porticoccus sp. W117]
MSEPQFELKVEGNSGELLFNGPWQLASKGTAPFSVIAKQLARHDLQQLRVTIADDCQWDSRLSAVLLSCHNYCTEQNIAFDGSKLPQGAQSLLKLATAVPTRQQSKPQQPGFNPWRALTSGMQKMLGFLGFLGECAEATGKLLVGRANMRFTDLGQFLFLAGPQALGIITLLSILVGMILAYLGAVQLRLLGAEVYVADLVAIGMVREMGALMTAIIMAGRTGAAYAAQLGTMQVNDEIDAVRTLGISPMEFLVLPRMVALILIMPLLVIYANILGIIGGAIVGLGMDISFLQYVEQSRQALDMTQVLSGLVKAVVFAALIAIAGCRAGMSCGRDSAAVGQATTKAVVTAIVYLVISDALLNILYSEMGI